MIPYIDHFFDTREKRYHFLVLVVLLASVMILLPYIFLSIELIQIQSYNDVFALLNKPIVKYTYVSRVILDVMSLASFSVLKLGIIFLNALRWYEGITLFCMLVIFPVMIKKRITLFCFSLLSIEIILISIVVIFALSSITLQMAITYLHWIGYTICIISLLQVCIIIYKLYQRVHLYEQALDYQVIEIKEHMDIES